MNRLVVLARLATWKRAFPWLIYQDGKMYCVDCQNSESNVECSFVTGCVNFRLYSIRSHDQSFSHKQVVAACLARENPQEAPMLRRYFSSVPEHVAPKMFNLAYLVAKKSCPLLCSPALFPWSKITE